MSDELEIDESEYEFSPEKQTELYESLNIREIVDMDEDTNLYETKEEEVKQLCVYIRNYDADGNLISSPVQAVKTCIDTFERSLTKTTWYENESVEQPDGSLIYKRVQKRDIREIMNASSFADEEILKVKPHIIEYRTFVNSFIRNYLNNFNINTVKGGKTLYIEFHNTSEDYEFYKITSDDIQYFIQKNYDIIGLNLDENELIIDNDKLLELKTLSFENAIINIESENGLSMLVDNLFMNNIKIKSLFKDKFVNTISVTASEQVKLTYISFTDEICKFDFLNTNTKDMQRWMQSNIDIYSIEFVDKSKTYNFPRESIFKFKSFHTVKINGVNLSFDELDMNVIKIENSMDVNLGSINFNANEFSKNLIILSKINKITACGIYGTQVYDQSKEIYLIHSSNGAIYGECKYTAIIGTNLGILSSNSDNCENINFNNIRSIKFNKPIKWNSVGVNKIIFSSCHFENLNSLSITVPNLSIFDSRFYNIENMELNISKKLFSTNNSYDGNKLNFVLKDDASVMISDDKWNFKEFNSSGNSGTGNINFVKSIINGNSMKLESMNKISSSDSNFDFKEMNISGININSFQPSFINSKLKEITLSGKIKRSVLFISSNNKFTINFNFNNIIGDCNIFYPDEVSSLNVNLDNAKIELLVDASKDKSEIDGKINVLCKSDSKGTILKSTKNTLKFVPKIEGVFKDFKQVVYDDNFKKKEYEDKLVYGYVK